MMKRGIGAPGEARLLAPSGSRGDVGNSGHEPVGEE
jgi:hypothetical protein